MTTRLWHSVLKFPVPGVALMVRTKSGEELEAVRPSYARSYQDDPNFRTLSGDISIQEVTEWAIK